MYRLSVNYNKLSKENVEKWNGIKAAEIKPGLNLVIGYLKVKTGQSALASKGTNHIVAAPAQPLVADVEPKTESSKTGIVQEKKQEPVAAEKPVMEKTTPPVVKNDLPKEQPKPVVVAPPTVARNGFAGQ